MQPRASGSDPALGHGQPGLGARRRRVSDRVIVAAVAMRPSTALVALVALGSLAAAACKEKPPTAAAPSASVAAPAPSEPAAEPPRAPQPPPEDLDLETARAELGCSEKVKGRESCRILEDFGAAERWEAKMPSGEGRWFGQAFVVTKGVESREFLLVRARRVPTAQVGPSDLPLMFGTGGLPEDRNEHAEKLIRALKDGGTGKKTNLARMYLTDFKPKEELGVLATKGKSVQLISEEDTFVRRSGVKRLLLVKLAGGVDAEKGDGVYAEVWSVSW